MITSLCRFRLAGVALAAAVLGGVSTAAPAARAAEPMAVIAFSGYDALMEDIDFIGGLTGQMQASQQAEMMIGMFTQNKGLEGLDKTQPIGVVLQSNNGMPEPLICIPVTDSDALLEVAKQFGVTAEDMGDGIMQIQSPGMPLFGKPVGGWLLLSIAPTAFDGAPADLGGMLTELTDEYDLAAKVMVQNIPPAWRQQAIEMISQAADQSMTRLPEESDADYEARKVQLQQGLDEMKQAVDELDKLTIGLSIDGENAKVGFDVVMTAIPDSKLAKEMSKNNDATTNFAGFFEPDAAMMMTLSAAAAENDLAQLDQQLATLRKQAYSGIDDEGKISDSGKEQLKSAVDDLLDAVEATLRAGKLDAGAVLNMAPGALTFVAGGAVVEPTKVETALKKVVEVGQEEGDDDMPEVAWAAKTYAGYTFHVFSKDVSEDDDDEVRAMFGDKVEMAVGIGKESVYFALGHDWLDKVKSVIDASAANPGKSVPPMELTIALGQIMDFAQAAAQDDSKNMLEMISSMIDNEANGRDHVRMVVQPLENGQRIRLEVEEGVLRSIAMAAMAAQMQAAGR